MSGKTTGLLSVSTSPVKVPAPHSAFISARPEPGDFLLEGLQNVVIVPGLGSVFECFVVSASKLSLIRGNAIAIFSDPLGSKEFDKFTLWAVAVVKERTPLVLSVFNIDKNNSDPLPKVISLFTVQNVFAFGTLGCETVTGIFISDPDFPHLVPYEAPVQSRMLPVSMASPLSMGALGLSLPGPPGGTSDSHRARKNAVECQNIKALFRQDAKSYLEFAGVMEDLGGDHVIASVQRAVPLSLLKVIALQPVNMRKTMALMFQLVVVEGQDTSKPFPGLHLTHFRFPNSGTPSFAQIKACYLNVKHILCAIVGNSDGMYFMENAFASSVERLNSVEEQSMSKMEPSVVRLELSVRLVNLSMVLSAAAALVDSDAVFLVKIRQALCVNEGELLQKNFWALSSQMSRSLAVSKAEEVPRHKKKWSGREFGQGVNAGAAAGAAAATGKPPGQKGFCIAEVCFKYLEAGKIYDTKPLKACIHGNVCRFDHAIPNAPVTAVQKAQFMSLTNLLAPERKAAMLVVMDKPTFSK